MKGKGICLVGVIAGVALIATATGCVARADKGQRRSSHLIELSKPGASMFLDTFDVRKILSAPAENAGNFLAYKVGFCDSTLMQDPKVKAASGEYYQYKMAKNWRVVINGDSVAPVFHQPVSTLDSKVHEVVLVFEKAAAIEPVKLVYQDETGLWDTQTFYLKVTK